MNDDDKKNNAIEDDYEYSRAVYYKLIEQGMEGLETMMELFKESEHPRAGEVFANMMRSVSDINDKLMDLQKKKAIINKDLPREDQQNQITQNNVFIGSTSDLQKALKEEENMVIVQNESDE